MSKIKYLLLFSLLAIAFSCGSKNEDQVQPTETGTINPNTSHSDDKKKQKVDIETRINFILRSLHVDKMSSNRASFNKYYNLIQKVREDFDQCGFGVNGAHCDDWKKTIRMNHKRLFRSTSRGVTKYEFESTIIPPFYNKRPLRLKFYLRSSGTDLIPEKVKIYVVDKNLHLPLIEKKFHLLTIDILNHRN